MSRAAPWPIGQRCSGRPGASPSPPSPRRRSAIGHRPEHEARHSRCHASTSAWRRLDPSRSRLSRYGDGSIRRGRGVSIPDRRFRRPAAGGRRSLSRPDAWCVGVLDALDRTIARTPRRSGGTAGIHLDARIRADVTRGKIPCKMGCGSRCSPSLVRHFRTVFLIGGNSTRVMTRLRRREARQGPLIFSTYTSSMPPNTGWAAERVGKFVDFVLPPT